MHLVASSILLVVVTSAALAQEINSPTPYPPPTQRLRIEQPNPATVHAAFNLGIGFAQYPILELPMSRFTSVRVDGSNASEDLVTNRGMLLSVELSRKDTSSRLPYTLSLGGLRAASPPGGGLPTPSSYVRIFAHASTDVASGIHDLSLIPSIEARRSMYRNVESGHYVDAILLKAGASYHVTNHSLFGISAGYAPLTTFGLSQSSDTGRSGTLANTSAKVSELSSFLSWTPEPFTSFEASVSQEDTLVTLKDVSGYGAYGLPAAPFENDHGTRSYDLTVRQIRLGTTKHF